MEGNRVGKEKRDGKGKEKRKGAVRGKNEEGNKVEKWEAGEENQVGGNFIHPCNFVRHIVQQTLNHVCPLI